MKVSKWVIFVEQQSRETKNSRQTDLDFPDHFHLFLIICLWELVDFDFVLLDFFNDLHVTERKKGLNHYGWYCDVVEKAVEETGANRYKHCRRNPSIVCYA